MRSNADIPIVQLNPGGVLNHKYAGEQAVRANGVPYSVVKPVGAVSRTFGHHFKSHCKADIPIVQLTPGGVLNHKYAGEQAVRASGVPYSVIKPVGEITSMTWHHLNKHTTADMF